MTDKKRPPGVDPSRAATRAILESLDSLVAYVSGQSAPGFLGVDVTMSQAKVLHVVSLHPGASMSTLAGELDVGLSAVSGLVDRLVDHGYLERHEDPADRRQQLVTITSEGRAVIDRTREFSVAHICPLLDGLSQAELEALRIGAAALERQARASSGLPPDAPATSHERTP